MSTSGVEDNSDCFSRMKKKMFTTINKYSSHEQEFVFVCKGKPFATLVSSNLPTPTSNLVDFDLVRDLNLKMTDLQCRKFYFAGNKFRILGRVSTTVQCLEGVLSGENFHIKGLVVADLNKILDAHCVAGGKMKQFLLSSINGDTSHVSKDVPDALQMPKDVPDALHVSKDLEDARHVPKEVHDVLHVPPDVHDVSHVLPVAHDAPHQPPMVHDARHVPHVVLDAQPLVHGAQGDPLMSPLTGARPRHLTCVQCHQDLSGTIDKEYIRCTTCHEKLLMMLAKMPHKWFQPAFREEMASVRGIKCRDEYSDMEIGFTDSDASSYCSEDTPFRRDWGKEPWKRNWEERLRRKRRR